MDDITIKDCPECEGTGEIEYEYEAIINKHVYSVVFECPICDGAGEVEEDCVEY